MASIQEPEVQFAQRLASNEKPIRTKAIKKLRKYINVRSQKAAGGFTGDELLKLWKGLFYCLWMQDKPLLQEELSNQITSLIHSFQEVDGQFLYLESFLQTLRREWTGIDRLRMDKFFQLVRFMFRQTFEMLKRKNWDSSVVSSFLELLTAQLLQSSSGAPSGLQLHVLDLYMTELAAVGSAELTADQNLIFIEPFCKTVSKTKDRILFSGICTNIFGTIIDQAPFAIEDLMKEVNAAQASDSDSGQASDEEDDDEEEEELREKTTRKPAGKKSAGKQINGNKSDEEDEDEDELLHLEEDSDTEEPCDEDIGPVLQFDYSALADRLFGLASRSGTPGRNRQRLYRIVKVLRDLSEGIFPQDEYPEEVSTDEDDDMFGSRKRMKRTGGRREEEEDEDGAPASKKKKGKKKEASTLNKQDKDSAKDDSEPADLTVNNENKKKKKRKKKKKKAAEGGESADKETEGSQTESAVSSVKVSDGSSETLLLSEVKEPSVTVTEETIDTSPSTTDDKTSEVEPEPQTPSDATVTGKKKKKKRKKAKLQTDETVAEPPAVVEEESTAVGTEESTTPETETTTPAKKKKKNAEKKLEEESQVNGVTTEEDGPKKPTDATTPGKKKSKKKSLKADEVVTVEAEAEIEVELEGKTTDAEITSVVEEAPQEAATVPLKKKKNKREETTLAVDESIVTPLKKKKSKNNQKQSTEEVDGAAVDEPSRVEDAEILPVTVTTAEKKKKKKKNQADEITDEAEVQEVEDEEKPAKKKKRKIPVTFEYEADELEAAAAINGLAEEEEETAVKKTKLEAAEPSTPLSSKKSQKKKKTPSGSESDFITFQSNAAVPTPLFCKTKGSPGTPRTGKKKSQTPKSESKKVTFGLKNNKTAEFRKTDRSLLVSPDGSSRVPFDPQQKPKFGVLKSPVTRLSTRVKKTPKKTPKKTSAGSPKSTPKSTPKRCPSAADFF